MTAVGLRPNDPDRVGKWAVVGRLGVGGFGTVYLGVDSDGKQGAVKCLHPALAADPSFLARFEREVELAQRVQGDFVARVIDFDRHHDPPYLVTEFVDGPTLQHAVARSGPLDPGPLYALALALAEAIWSIKEAGVVHRDLKPSNVLLTAAAPVVVDFGIASAPELTRLTATGAIVGTYPYMAPEQVRNAGSSPSIDVFAWGSVITFAATAEPPFGLEATPFTVMERILHSEAEYGTMDQRLQTVVREAHRKEPSARPTIEVIVGQLVELNQSSVVPTRPDSVVTLVERTWTLPISATDKMSLDDQTAPSGPTAPTRFVVEGDAERNTPANVSTHGQTRGEPAWEPAKTRPVPWSPADWFDQLVTASFFGIVPITIYFGFGIYFQNAERHVTGSLPDDKRVYVQSFAAAWGYRPYVALMTVILMTSWVLVPLRLGEALRLPKAGWRVLALMTSLANVALGLLPWACGMLLSYGTGWLEPLGAISSLAGFVSGLLLFLSALSLLVGIPFAVYAAWCVLRSLFGDVVV